MAKKRKPLVPLISRGRLKGRELAKEKVYKDFYLQAVAGADASSDFWEEACRELAMGIGLFVKSNGELKMPMAIAIGKLRELLEEVPEV